MEEDTMFWMMIMLISVAGMFTGLIQKSMNMRHRERLSRVRSAETDDKILQRLERLEKRVGNLETLVIERDKTAMYEKL